LGMKGTGKSEADMVGIIATCGVGWEKVGGCVGVTVVMSGTQ
jgi:hypothetical protein